MVETHVEKSLAIQIDKGFVTFVDSCRLVLREAIVLMYRNTQNQDVVRLLLLLKTVEREYPFRMMSQRRTTFMSLIYKYLFWRPRA
jgi:hypothetical protein